MAGVATLLAAAYRYVELADRQLPWLVTLGRTAFMLYVVHQVVESTIVRRALGVALDDWWLYAAATVAFIALLVALGRVWLAAKAAWRGKATS